MKTTTNVQKTNLISLIFAAGLIVIGFSVDGQGATKPDLTIDNNKHFAFASTRTLPATAASKVTGTTASFAAYTAPATEEALTLENWMTEENRFDGTDAFFANATDKPLQIEPWMTDASYFEDASAVFETAADDALLVEEWMLNEKSFEGVADRNLSAAKKNYIIYSAENYVIREIITEPVLQFEKWMFSNKLWK